MINLLYIIFLDYRQKAVYGRDNLVDLLFIFCIFCKWEVPVNTRGWEIMAMGVYA